MAPENEIQSHFPGEYKKVVWTLFIYASACNFLVFLLLLVEGNNRKTWWIIIATSCLCIPAIIALLPTILKLGAIVRVDRYGISFQNRSQFKSLEWDKISNVLERNLLGRFELINKTGGRFSKAGLPDRKYS